jgi:hypothetical protein
MAGSGGTLLNGATGTGPADGWIIYAGGGTVNAVASKTSWAGYTNLSKQTIALSGTADLTICKFFQTVPSGWSVGDTLVGEVEVDWNITSGSVVSVFAQINQQLDGTLAWDGAATSYGDLTGGGAYPGGSAGQSILLRPEAVTIPGGATSIVFMCGIQVGASGPVGVTVN